MTAPFKNKSLNQSQFTNTSELQSDKLKSIISNIRIVMVNTTLPANIGSAARAMLTMGFTDLVVVDPKLPIDDTSYAHAAGASQLLNKCKVVETIEDALQDCHLVFAASSRNRHIPRPVVTPIMAGQIIMTQNNSHNEIVIKEPPQIAILFGREDRGLTNTELSMADYHIQIDANPDYPVLNVASAIQVITSFLYSYFLNSLVAKSSVELSHCKTAGNKLNKFEFNNYTSESNVIVDDNKTVNNIINKDVINQDNDNKTLELFIRHIWDAPAITHKQKKKLQSQFIQLMLAVKLIESKDDTKLKELPNRLSRLVSRLQLDQKEYELINALIAKIKLNLKP